ncbi:hypothetical protein [Halorarius halobius]|uniref:hypothetical protein n=1 Tax=Halorarius halobius TaxID=2962671 RepID=UPI0020CF291D|nr:hypothetical protein [Halorarius halobius]
MTRNITRRVAHLTTFAFVAALLVAGWRFTAGDTGIALGLVGGGAVAFAGRVYLSVRGRVDLRAQTVRIGGAVNSPRGRRVGSVALAGLLVTSTFAGAGVAATTCEFSTTGTAIQSFLYSLGATDSPLGGECTHTADKSDIADLQAMAETAASANHTFVRSQYNFAKDRRAVAWSEGKLATAHALNNGSNVSVAKEQFNQSVVDYYEKPYIHTLAAWQNRVSVLEYLFKADPQNTTVTPSYPDRDIEGFVTVNLTQYNNGSDWSYTTDIRVPVWSLNGLAMWEPPTFGNDPNLVINSINNSSAYIPSTNNDTSSLPNSFDTNVDPRFVYNGTHQTVIMKQNIYDVEVSYYSLWEPSLQIRANGGPFVEEVYQKYEAGELNASDLLGTAELAGRSSTSYNSTGYYSFLAVEMATLGWHSDLNTSFTVDYNGSTYNGQVFYSGDDSVTFENGTTYHPVNYNGSFYMAAQTANGSKVLPLEDNFTVTRLTNPVSGDDLNKTTTEQYTYATGNASALQAELDKLAELREELKEANSAASGGSDSDSGVGAKVIIGVLALVGLAAWAKQNDGGDRRGGR